MDIGTVYFIVFNLHTQVLKEGSGKYTNDHIFEPYFIKCGVLNLV